MWRVGERAVSVELDVAVARRCVEHCAETVAVGGVAVVGQHVPADGRVLGCGVGVIDADRCAVDRVDGDRHQGGAAVLAVEGRVDELVRTVIVGVGLVAERTVGRQHQAPVLRSSNDGRDQVSAVGGVDVVRQDVPGDGTALIGDVGVVGRRRRLGRGNHIDPDQRGVGVAPPVRAEEPEKPVQVGGTGVAIAGGQAELVDTCEASSGGV